MALTAEQFAKQQKQVEELLADGAQRFGFAKAIFFGQFNGDLLFPYPEIKPEERDAVAKARAELLQFSKGEWDANAIDRNAEISDKVVAGLGRIGVLGMTAPKEYGGQDFSQLGYCKIMEFLGGYCGSTTVFVNAHQSIGLRALVLFGTEEQKRKWLPSLTTGEKLAAFALTEPEAGSDAANVQTTATPTPDGRTYILNGQKRYITNGAISQVLTVMARTPVPGSSDTNITAFLVTPDMPGFKVLEARMPKLGIRGTATGRLAFENMPVPGVNILGQLGKGLKIALTVLDFGRTTFGASCTGAAKVCMEAAIRHANTRKQFQQTLGEFELVKKKIAFMGAHAFAMEAMTSECASFIDRGAEDYMLETAMLKVWSTEALWTIVNDTIQIFGGQAFFTYEPYERMMRDARLNQIGEGANDVLKAFIAVVGMRAVGEELLKVRDAAMTPIKGSATLWKFVRNYMGNRLHLTAPAIPVSNPSLYEEAAALSRRVRDFGIAVQSVFFQFRRRIPPGLSQAETILRFAAWQYPQERTADAACDLYASACTLSRLDSILSRGNHSPESKRDELCGRYFIRLADRRIRANLAAITDNDDDYTTLTANKLLGKS
jgi:alkylation response protein AidB-like acyl-CoA dehydrogenase